MCLGAIMGNMVTYNDLQFSLHISLRIYQIEFNQTSMRFCHMQRSPPCLELERILSPGLLF